MPNKPKKGPAQKLRLFEGDQEILDAIAEKTRCSAGLQAIKDNNYEFHAPLRFAVVRGKAPAGESVHYGETAVTLVQSPADGHALQAAEAAPAKKKGRGKDTGPPPKSKAV